MLSKILRQFRWTSWPVADVTHPELLVTIGISGFSSLNSSATWGPVPGHRIAATRVGCGVRFKAGGLPGALMTCPGVYDLAILRGVNPLLRSGCWMTLGSPAWLVLMILKGLQAMQKLGNEEHHLKEAQLKWERGTRMRPTPSTQQSSRMPMLHLNLRQTRTYQKSKRQSRDYLLTCRLTVRERSPPFAALVRFNSGIAKIPWHVSLGKSPYLFFFGAQGCKAQRARARPART